VGPVLSPVEAEREVCRGGKLERCGGYNWGAEIMTLIPEIVAPRAKKVQDHKNPHGDSGAKWKV